MTWKYLPVLNSMIQILVTVGMGGVFGYTGIFNAQDFVTTTVRFVFYVALPCLVLSGIGININFYSDKLLWNYIVAFLILRAIALVVVFVVVLAGNWKERKQRRGLGHVAVAWLALTWISTVIMGIPIMTALFGGDPATGQLYGLLAGISSFIFQLPLQLAFLECHALDSDATEAETPENSPPQEETKDTSGQPLSKDLVAGMDETWSQASNPASSERVVETARKVSHDKTDVDAAFVVVEEAPEDMNLTLGTETPVKWWVLTGEKYVNHRDVWLDVLRRVVRNPVIWGIFGGFVLSLSTVGPTYLKGPKSMNDDFVEGLAWIPATLAWLGDTVSPLSLFTMGVWMQAQGLHKLLLPIPLPKLTLFMVSKLVVVPLVMVGLAKAMSLENEAGRAAVLIASLPISLASFSLGHQYRIGEAELSANVATGTLLMLPTILVWNVVMDNLGLFPVVATTG